MSVKTREDQKIEQISDWHGESYRMNLGHDEHYGTPVPGSKTDIRGRQAGQHISQVNMRVLMKIARIVT